MIETESVTDKISILKGKKVLKDYKQHVYINEDLTREEMEIQKIIWKMAAIERSKGNRIKRN